jgi:type II secretory pathway pseudopilin PulG
MKIQIQERYVQERQVRETQIQESMNMRRAKGRSRGFTLVASLLVLVLLSAIAVSLLFMVQGAGKVGGNDLETNRAYYGAESGMELLTANLAALYQQSQAPTPLQITNLTNNPPDNTMIANMAYQENIAWTPDANGNPASHPSVISSGPNAGLNATIIPLTLKVTATRPGGASVNMTRGVEVALIPVFQFGVFSDSDLSYFAGPPFAFQGRVHTNGNLYLAANSGPLIIDAKTTAVGQIIRDRLANNYSAPPAYGGDVYLPNLTGGCDPPNPTANANCLKFTIPLASWSGGIPPAGALTNPATWTNTSTVTFGGFIGNGASLGVQPLTLPFVQGANGAAQQIQIIRKPPFGELPSTPTGSSREFNKANIRVLLASTQADLVPDRPALVGDADNINLDNACAGGRTDNVTGVGVTPWAMAQLPAAQTVSTGGVYEPSWLGPAAAAPAIPGACVDVAGQPWPLVDGWLRVEYRNAAGNWIGVTRAWLQLGFARGTAIPTVVGANPVHRNAILIFQKLAGDRNLSGTITAADGPQNITGANSQYSWNPINFYDPREGFPRDSLTGTPLAGTQCYVNGIMNAVEIDVGNLNQWVLGNIGAGGPLVDYTGQNGYLLFFSDRRGMFPDPNGGGITTGEYGFEDVINSGSATGTPDGVLEPIGPTGFSPEDVDENTVLDRWGAANVGNGFKAAFPAINTVNNPYQPVDCLNGGRQNIVTGARRVLRLIDGGLNNLPVRPDNGLGGFTVSAENPVYVMGDYNSNAGDPWWNAPVLATPDIPHSAAAVIADSVTLLSNGWSDINSMQNALVLGNRPATTTYYRLAIAGGKNMNFPQPGAGNGIGADFGTDGGVHNFLRYIESWGGATLSYRGSLVSLYYSEYATGTFKCCTLVYSPPNRNYYFDSAFLDPNKLPPGTPMLQDVVNLTYWQDFRPY